MGMNQRDTISKFGFTMSTPPRTSVSDRNQMGRGVRGLQPSTYILIIWVSVIGVEFPFLFHFLNFGVPLWVPVTNTVI